MEDISEIHRIAGVPPLISPLLMPFSVLQQTAFGMITALPPLPGMVVMQATEDTEDETETAPVRRNEPLDKRKTAINQKHDYTIRRSEILLDENSPGELEELMVRSSSKFSVELLVNGVMAYSKSISDLIDLSEDVNGITAAYRSGIYRFSIGKIEFESIFVRVYLSGTGVFDTYTKVGAKHGR